MPNHIKNVIHFGADVDQTRLDVLFQTVLATPPAEETAGEEIIVPFFDFNTLIPMPASLGIESGSRTSQGILLYKIMLSLRSLSPPMIDNIMSATRCGDVFVAGTLDEVSTKYKSLMKLLHPDVCTHPKATEAAAKLNGLYDHAKKLIANHTWENGTANRRTNIFHVPGANGWEMDGLKATIQRAGFDPHDIASLSAYMQTNEGKQCYALGETAYKNEQMYGYTTWYDWCCKYWGTKWNSYDNNINRQERTISFSTAWSCPAPIVEALASKFPDVDFTWEYADEDCGCNTGRYIHENCVLDFTMFESQSDEGYQMYVTCWGADECMYQDEAGAWRRYNCDDCPHKCY